MKTLKFEGSSQNQQEALLELLKQHAPEVEMKITCGRAHFKVLDGVLFERVEKLEEIQTN